MLFLPIPYHFPPLVYQGNLSCEMWIPVWIGVLRPLKVWEAILPGPPPPGSPP